MDEIYDFYNNGAEIGRLERGLGIVEFLRTKGILSRYIDGGKVIYDIGGGIGMYAAWLAKKGNEVHLVELAENAVEYAKANMMQDCHFIAETGNALQVNRPDESADVVLLMGPCTICAIGKSVCNRYARRFECLRKADYCLRQASPSSAP